MHSLKDHRTQEQLLIERLITFNNRKNQGQIVLLAGGAGSGKGFAKDKFIDSSSFLVRDVDEYKKQWLSYSKLTGKYPELQNMDLRNPNDVANLHAFVKEKGYVDKKLNLLLRDMNKNNLPNVMFDITFKDLADGLEAVVPMIKAGYDPKDIHIVWVLTDYRIAVINNRTRERIIPDDILLKTHEGAARTMTDVITKQALPRRLVDGSFTVILNNPEETIYWKDKSGKEITTKSKSGRSEKVVKNFAKLRLKEPGKPMTSSAKVMNQLMIWITKNIPKSLALRDLFKKDD